MKKRLIYVVCLAMFCILSLECSTIEGARKGTLVVAIPRDVLNLDPHLMTALATYQVVGNIYEGLTKLDDNFDVVPCLAESWTSSGDGLRWTFKIRQGVRFHNGREMTAQDIVYSLTRVIDPETASPWKTRLEAIKSVVASGDYEVVVTLKHPYGPFLYMLTYKTAAIVPNEIVSQYGNLNLHPCGTGPFVLEDWIPQTSVTLVANKDYWQKGIPYLERVVLRVVPEGFSRAVALKNEEVHAIDLVPFYLVDDLKRSKNIEYSEVPSSWIDYVGFNCTRPPFNDVRVRQAMALVIDREAIIKTALFGHGAVAYHNIPEPSPFGIKVNVPLQNIDEAKRLLAQAGYPNGFVAENSVLGGYETMKAAAETLQAQLRVIGIDLKPVVTEPGIYEEKVVNKRDYDAFVTGSVEGLEPSLRTDIYFITNAAYNVCGYGNNEVDRLLQKARELNEKSEREALYSAAMQKIVDDSPILVFYNMKANMATLKNVKGLKPHPDWLYDFSKVSLDE